ncbi:glycosyltransferase [Candidatus Babeliales bacterium]|nr:glycosyltransferase [Candidatus Babeliales bacterium]MCF7899102.1 glycosyltransferase [Candidatus Babeliales bacterium]
MKVLHLITSLKIGGAESALYNLLLKLKSDNTIKHYVVYFYYGPNVNKIKKLGIDTYKINGLFCKYDPFFYFKLKKIVKKINPDIIHSALWSSNLFARIIGNKLKIPVICDLHSNFLHDGKLRIFLEKLFLSLPAHYIAVSNTAKDGFQKAIIKNCKNKDFVKTKLNIISNGIDYKNIVNKSEQIKFKKQDLGFFQDTFVFGAVGRLEPIKSYDLLIKAFAIFLKNLKTDNRVKLCLVGDGSQKLKLEEQAKTLGIFHKIFFAGEQTEILKFYKIFDCFVLSSQTEGLSISLLEALCFGLPIITTHRYEKHDVLTDQKNGFIVPANNELKLSQAMQSIYYNSTLREKIKTNNLNLVKYNFCIDNTVELYKKVYINIFNKKV